MEPVVVAALLLAVLVLWGRFLQSRSAARTRSPLWGAFTATSAAILFIIAGAVGYKLDHGIPFTIRSAWTKSVLWSEIWVGLGLAVAAVYLWRLGLRSLRA